MGRFCTAEFEKWSQQGGELSARWWGNEVSFMSFHAQGMLKQRYGKVLAESHSGRKIAGKGFSSA